MKQRLLGLFLICSFLSTARASEDIILNGAGATFPHPLYKKWIQLYEKQSTTRITYEAIGSGGGIRRLMAREVDFGGTDAFLSDAELKKCKQDIVQIPSCLGAVVITYNLPGQPELHFSPELIEGIYMGEITRWSDRRIRKENPGLTLPDIVISVIHRSDSSGTTFIFTDYLSKISDSWNKEVGHGKTVNWPVGLGVDGNPNVAKFIHRIEGSIGYLEMAYASDQGLPVASLLNRSGNIVKPTLSAVTSAANINLPDDMRIMITNTSAADGYPISAFTYLIFYGDQAYDQRTEGKGRALCDFLSWIIHDGQQFAVKEGYAPLPKSAVVKAEKLLSHVTYRQSLLLN